MLALQLSSRQGIKTKASFLLCVAVKKDIKKAKNSFADSAISKEDKRVLKNKYTYKTYSTSYP